MQSTPMTTSQQQQQLQSPSATSPNNNTTTPAGAEQSQTQIQQTSHSQAPTPSQPHLSHPSPHHPPPPRMHSPDGSYPVVPAGFHPGYGAPPIGWNQGEGGPPPQYAGAYPQHGGPRGLPYPLYPPGYGPPPGPPLSHPHGGPHYMQPPPFHPHPGMQPPPPFDARGRPTHTANGGPYHPPPPPPHMHPGHPMGPPPPPPPHFHMAFQGHPHHPHPGAPFHAGPYQQQQPPLEGKPDVGSPSGDPASRHRVGPSSSPSDQPQPILMTHGHHGVGPNTAPATDPQYGEALYKTELCKSFSESGYCRYGLKCRFAHGLSDLRLVQRHKKYKTQLCRNFTRDGACPYGPRCRFIHNQATHDQDELPGLGAVQSVDQVRGLVTTTTSASAPPASSSSSSPPSIAVNPAAVAAVAAVMANSQNHMNVQTNSPTQHHQQHQQQTEGGQPNHHTTQHPHGPSSSSSPYAHPHDGPSTISNDHHRGSLSSSPPHLQQQQQRSRSLLHHDRPLHPSSSPPAHPAYHPQSQSHSTYTPSNGPHEYIQPPGGITVNFTPTQSSSRTSTSTVGNGSHTISNNDDPVATLFPSSSVSRSPVIGPSPSIGATAVGGSSSPFFPPGAGNILPGLTLDGPAVNEELIATSRPRALSSSSMLRSHADPLAPASGKSSIVGVGGGVVSHSPPIGSTRSMLVSSGVVGSSLSPGLVGVVDPSGVSDGGESSLFSSPMMLSASPSQHAHQHATTNSVTQLSKQLEVLELGPNAFANEQQQQQQ